MAGDTNVTISGSEAIEAALQQLVDQLPSVTLELGFYQGDLLSDGSDVTEIASAEEFGSFGSPPRPFFRNMMEANQDSWTSDLGGILESLLKSEPAMMSMGEHIKSQLQDSINGLGTSGDELGDHIQFNVQDGAEDG